MSRTEVRDAVFVWPRRARSLFTVRAAISFARFVETPRSRSLSLMCSYFRSCLSVHSFLGTSITSCLIRTQAPGLLAVGVDPPWRRPDGNAVRPCQLLQHPSILRHVGVVPVAVRLASPALVQLVVRAPQRRVVPADVGPLDAVVRRQPPGQQPR